MLPTILYGILCKIKNVGEKPMKSIILEKLCQNDVLPWKLNKSKDYEKKSDKCDKLYKKAKDMFGDRFDVVEELLNENNSLMADESHQYFAEGLKLGILLGIESAAILDEE